MPELHLYGQSCGSKDNKITHTLFLSHSDSVVLVRARILCNRLRGRA